MQCNWGSRTLLVVLSVVLAGLVGLPPAAHAGILERIAADGILKAGTRADAAPFATRTADGRFEGFSVDLLEAIRAAAETRTGRPVVLEIHAVTPSDRLRRVAEGELHVVCGITTPTHEREAVVDFALPFFRDGTRVLAFRDTIEAGASLDSMIIGVAEGTTTPAIVTSALPGASLRTYPEMRSAMEALIGGEVAGIANVGIVLLGLAREMAPNRSVVLLPRTEALSQEVMACVLPENDSAWRDLVNRTLVDLLDGIGDFRGRYMEIYDRWFGREAGLVYPLDRDNRDFLQGLNIWTR
jgi:polar amino acid transport system substrate-binding protein